MQRYGKKNPVSIKRLGNQTRETMWQLVTHYDKGLAGQQKSPFRPLFSNNRLAGNGLLLKRYSIVLKQSGVYMFFLGCRQCETHFVQPSGRGYGILAQEVVDLGVEEVERARTFEAVAAYDAQLHPSVHGAARNLQLFLQFIYCQPLASCARGVSFFGAAVGCDTGSAVGLCFFIHNKSFFSLAKI